MCHWFNILENNRSANSYTYNLATCDDNMEICKEPYPILLQSLLLNQDSAANNLQPNNIVIIVVVRILCHTISFLLAWQNLRKNFQGQEPGYFGTPRIFLFFFFSFMNAYFCNN